jgi:hypothetical protein
VLDAVSNVYVAGYFEGGGDFDPGAGNYPLSASTYGDAFVLKLNSAGAFVWAQQLAGSHQDVANSIALDASGNVYTAGFFRLTTDFDPGPGTFNLSTSMAREMFISILTSGGNFVSAYQIGGAGDDEAVSITVDGGGNIYSTGYFENAGVDFDPSPGTFVLNGNGWDAFVLKLSGNAGAGVPESYLNNNTVQLYPNPTSGLVNVFQNTPDANQIEVYNSIGSLVYSADLIEHTVVIDLTDNSAGIYFLKIKTQEGILTKKIIKD